ncbi:metal ABC transporter ATP-binding protein [Thiorhodovibrio frisius]|uniref:ATPase component of Mn/Zn ABC-type transporter n=1 Tax=Thiorhodovibrio frisius TaxID=631362 RepID=H8YZS5_9GAMM|nr:metal ABC transporter ATP-binding protein [Thiorhodovibrio frisius]EIC22202.1 ATPase component of Mn/Zn ABC-type transporter [Thiorhodovibrio frisius]WPL24496.1 putative zinc transport system ATP-binding protein AdcC [Thiorhodovibrio frisius]
MNTAPKLESEPEHSADAEVVISAQALSFSYDAVRVLDAVTLDVRRGEFLGLVGPNAGGKSTLLKLILGLLEPTAGRLWVLGQAPRQARRRIGYVPQYPAFARDFPITVADAVLMGRLGTRRLMLRYAPQDRAAVTRALREVEAEDLARRPIGKLSGGQLQRVLLARALVGEPEILILDEPTANIDQRVEGEIFELLAQLNARMTILVVSHDIAFISGYVSRVACLNRTLVCHTTGTVDGRVITDLYGERVRGILHDHAF